MIMRGRPARQRQALLRYVCETVAKDGYAPSYGMICKAVGIRTRHEVCRIVSRLEEDGYLRRAGNGRVRRIHLLNYAN